MKFNDDSPREMLKGHTGKVYSVVYSPDGQQLASCSDDMTVRIWDAATGSSLHKLDGHTKSVFSVVYSPDGQQLASCSDDKTVRIWDAATGSCLHKLDGHTDSVFSVGYSPDGRQLASSSRDETAITTFAAWPAESSFHFDWSMARRLRS